MKNSDVLIRKKKEKELAMFKGLLKESKRWHDLVMLRNYIDAVETQARNKNDLTEDRKKWIEWARKKVEWYDPFILAEDELLSDIDPAKLSW